MRVIMIILAILLALTTAVLAANDPGHDTLYVEQTGDSLLTGNLNISDEFKVANLFYSAYLDILGNNSQPSGSFAQIYARSTGTDLVLNAPTSISLARDSGSLVQVGVSGVDLNVSGNGTVQNNFNIVSGSLQVAGTVRISNTGIGTFASGTQVNGQDVCTADGTNCPASGGSGGGWLNSTTTVYLANNGTNVSIGNTTGSLPLFYIDTANGRVGIGTKAPAAKFTINASEDSEFIRLNDATNSDSIGIFTGSGSPEGVVTAQLGSIYSDHASGKLYKKGVDGGNTGWEEVVAGNSSHMAKMNSTVGQSVDHATDTLIDFNNVEFDYGGIANTSGDRFTVKRDGVYFVTGSYADNAKIDSGELLQLYIFVNGIKRQVQGAYSVATDGYPRVNINEMFFLNTGDYVQLYIKQDEGAAITLQTIVTSAPKFAIVELSTTGAGSKWTDGGSSTYLTETSDNVAIGTTSATQKLHVEGSINVSSGNLSLTSTYSMCFNADCSSRIYHNGSALIIEGT